MKTFEWGLLKICCAFLCMLTLLTACSNEELVENTSNCVGEEYEQSFEDYVLIRKEDYWNSRPNYLRFKYYE